MQQANAAAVDAATPGSYTEVELPLDLKVPRAPLASDNGRSVKSTARVGSRQARSPMTVRTASV